MQARGAGRRYRSGMQPPVAQAAEQLQARGAAAKQLQARRRQLSNCKRAQAAAGGEAAAKAHAVVAAADRRWHMVARICCGGVAARGGDRAVAGAQPAADIEVAGAAAEQLQARSRQLSNCRRVQVEKRQPRPTQL